MNRLFIIVLCFCAPPDVHEVPPTHLKCEDLFSFKPWDYHFVRVYTDTGRMRVLDSGGGELIGFQAASAAVEKGIMSWMTT